MQKTIILMLLLACGTAASGADDPVARLRGARSLRCAFTSSVETGVRSGHRSIEQTNDKGSAVYDNITAPKGTARIVSNGGASNLVVWRDAQDNL